MTLGFIKKEMINEYGPPVETVGPFSFFSVYCFQFQFQLHEKFQGKAYLDNRCFRWHRKRIGHPLAEKGAQIILTARSTDKLNQVKNSLLGEGHLVYPIDLMRINTIANGVDQLIQQVKRIDMVIHSAGVSQRSLVKDTTLAVDRKIMELDYFAIVAITKELLPHMIDNNKGFIVAISSVAGKIGTPMRSAYCGAKHALIGFMDSLRAEVMQRILVY